MKTTKGFILTAAALLALAGCATTESTTGRGAGGSTGMDSDSTTEGLPDNAPGYMNDVPNDVERGSGAGGSTGSDSDSTTEGLPDSAPGYMNGVTNGVDRGSGAGGSTGSDSAPNKGWIAD